MFQFSGKVSGIEDLKEGTTKKGDAWAARNFMVEGKDGEYTTNGVFKLFQMGDKTKYVVNPSFKVGDSVTVSFSLRGSEYKGKYYAECSAYKVEVDSSSTPVARPQPQTSAVVDDDDLPF